MARRSANSARCLQELQELLLNLRDIKVTAQGPYTPRHEYEDFRLTFADARGARTLSLISDILTPAPVLPGMLNTEHLWWNEALRWAWGEILIRLSGERVIETEKPDDDYDPRDQH